MVELSARRPGFPPSQTYHLGPFRLNAPLPLPLLAADEAASDADPVVRLAAAAHGRLQDARFATSALVVDRSGRARIDMAGVAGIEIRDGREIAVTPAPGLAERDIAAQLMAGPLAALCCQRGFVPFRFAVLDIGGAAVVLAGAAGVGKSTLALALADHGARLVSDDLSMVSFHRDATGRPGAVAWPGTRRIAVWGDIPAEVAPARAAEPIRDDISRHFIDVPGSGPQPLPVRAVVLLRVGAAGGSVLRMGRAAAMARLLDLVTDRAPIRRLGADGALLTTVGGLCRAAPTFRLERGTDLSALPELAAQVLAIAEDAGRND
jgi:hypothetical protein